MKKNGSYRYNLKFSCDDRKNARAGELLERLGHRKSAVVVEALNDYLDRHPALEQGGCAIHIMEGSGRTMPPESWMEIVARMIEEKVGLLREQKYDEPEPEPEQMLLEEPQEPPNADISRMLDNLESFFSR